MNKKLINILSFLKYISFTCVLYSLTIQSIISSNILIDEVRSQIIELDVDENSNSDENQESEEEEEFKNLKSLNSYFGILNSLREILNSYKLNLLQDINFDIHIPPPERI